MIVPFMFGVEEKEAHYLWIFYKYLEFALKNNIPIIAQEEYFIKPSIYKENNHWLFDGFINGYQENYELKEPTDDDLEELQKISITKEEEKMIFSDVTKTFENNIALLEERNKNFEDIIQQKIIETEKITGKKIEAFITWVWFPSLEYVAKKNGIEIFTFEQSTFRKPIYNEYLGYCSLYNKYDGIKTRELYEAFIKENKVNKYLNRKEILSLFLSKENISYLNDLNNKSEFPLGIDLGADRDAYYEVYSNFSHDEIINMALKVLNKEDISVRTHPMRPSKVSVDCQYDTSKNSIEWILKCRRLVTSVSNLGFEAMLYGKTSYVLGENMPFYFKAINDIKQLEDGVVSEEFINFITFGYYVPFGLMFDYEYLKWRLKNPSITAIYQKNLDYVFNKKDISKDILDYSHEDRMKEILKKIHGANYDEFILENNSNSTINEITHIERESVKAKAKRVIRKILKITLRIMPVPESKKKEWINKYKNRNVVNRENVLKWAMRSKVVSFDIFDTLITRKIYAPDDLFDMMGEILTDEIDGDFKEIRKKAEANATTRLQKDVNIHEIYNQMGMEFDYSKDQINKFKKLEQDLEIEFCVPRYDMLDIFNILKMKRKKILLISDMYLDEETIVKMLDKCGYHGYYKFYLSNQLNKRKDNGSMWEYIKSKYPKLLHIGDNEYSDYWVALYYKVKAVKIDSGNHLLQKSPIIQNFTKQIERRSVSDSVLLGHFINYKLFNSPFVELTSIDSLTDFCYIYIAPLILEFMEFIENNTDKNMEFLFLSREGYELQKIYKKYCEIFNKIECKNRYFLTSRRATVISNIKNSEDLIKMCDREFRGTVKSFFLQLFNLEYTGEYKDYRVNLPNDKKMMKKLVMEMEQEILKKAKIEKDNYLQYCKDFIISNNNIKLIDLGYTGTIQYNLSKLFERDIDGVYFVSSDKRKEYTSKSNLSFCFDTNKNNEFISVYHYSLILEYFFSAPFGQLLYFEKKEGKLFPIYNEEVINEEQQKNIKIMKEALFDYFMDINQIKRKYNLVNDKEFLLNNFKKCIDINENLSTTLKDVFVITNVFDRDQEYNVFKQIGKY